jgi:hypothetical protein
MPRRHRFHDHPAINLDSSEITCIGWLSQDASVVPKATDDSQRVTPPPCNVETPRALGYCAVMAKKEAVTASTPTPSRAAKPSASLDSRVVYCGDNLEQLAKLPDACVDLIYIDPPFNSNRNYEVFWGETKEKRAFEDRHASTQAYIVYMRPRCAQPACSGEPARFITTATGTPRICVLVEEHRDDECGPD